MIVDCHNGNLICGCGINSVLDGRTMLLLHNVPLLY